MFSIWCGLFAVVVADWPSVFGRLRLGRFDGTGSVSLPCGRQFSGRAAGGGSHSVATAIGRKSFCAGYVVGAGWSSGSSAGRLSGDPGASVVVGSGGSVPRGMIAGVHPFIGGWLCIQEYYLS